MPLTRKGYLLLGLIVALFAAVTALALSTPFYYTSPLGVAIRLFGLYGFLMIAVALMLTPFLSAVYRTFGRPFLKIHHFFAISGIVLITLHPVSFAVLVMTPVVFIPSIQSWIDFWVNAGRAALIVLYVAVIAVLLRRRIRHWRYLHALMYLVLLLAIVHANLIGTDFVNTGIRVIYDSLFIGVVIVFLLSLRRKLSQRTARHQTK